MFHVASESLLGRPRPNHLLQPSFSCQPAQGLTHASASTLGESVQRAAVKTPSPALGTAFALFTPSLHSSQELSTSRLPSKEGERLPGCSSHYRDVFVRLVLLLRKLRCAAQKLTHLLKLSCFSDTAPVICRDRRSTKRHAAA